MPALRLIFADQLSLSLATLSGTNKQADTIMLCELMEEATYVPHHPKKIAFLYAAMRHFATDLLQAGYNVRYVKLEDPANTHSFSKEITRATNDLNCTEIITTEPGEWRLLQMIKSWQATLALPLEIRDDDRFLCSTADFAKWAANKKQLRMEFFYQQMRKKYNILLEPGGKPAGGTWNYDKDNRKPPKTGLSYPKRISHKKSEITKEVLQLVCAKFPHHFGTLEPFHYAVTPAQAHQELDHFIAFCLPHFGDYQDAMVAGEPFLYHSLISTYLNAGLLLPHEICTKAENAYRSGAAPLNAVEGFIRQILGWREFVRGIYWLHMPDYANLNFFTANTPLPAFYWGATTNMFCVAETVAHTRAHAYSHHIQRLMITGNFALLAGLDVKEVQAWYLAVYSDAYEWVEMPNTLGMALYGDGGIMASKPYAASGSYIHRMSNYCQKCAYNPKELIGETACPFNALYWDFMARNQSKLRGNQRMPYVFSTWDKFGPAKQQAIHTQAMLVLNRMQEGTL